MEIVTRIYQIPTHTFDTNSRPEAATPIPQQAVHGRGLTAYDTVAV